MEHSGEDNEEYFREREVAGGMNSKCWIQGRLYCRLENEKNKVGNFETGVVFYAELEK